MLCILCVVLAVSACGEQALDRRTTGDPRAGLSTYKAEGCYACHAVADVSVGETGPALDGEGSRRGAPWLRTMLPSHLQAEKLRPLSRRDMEDLVSYLVDLR